MGVKSLADRLAISKEEAQELYDLYFSAFANVGSWIENAKLTARQCGYSQSRMGRIHRIWDYTKSDEWQRANGDRLAVNAPIQGMAADVMRLAMIRADRAITAAGLADRVRLFMNVHDALEYYVHNSLDPHEVRAVIEPAVLVDIPGYPKLVADWHVGTRWGSVVDLEPGTPTPEPEVVPSVIPTVEEPPVVIEHNEDEHVVLTIEDTQEIEIVGRTLVINVAGVPAPERWTPFVQLVKDCPGTSMVRLVTPAGERLFDTWRTGLTPKDEGRISLLLGGAVVSWDLDSIDLTNLAAGLIL
jgi:hypothetical protein